MGGPQCYAAAYMAIGQDVGTACFISIHMELIPLSLMQASFGEGYINEADPSVLRFLIASRDEVSSKQLRDDLLSMLVAGHETTGSVLTWTLYLLEQNPSAMAKVKSRSSDHSYTHTACQA